MLIWCGDGGDGIFWWLIPVVMSCILYPSVYIVIGLVTTKFYMSISEGK